MLFIYTCNSWKEFQKEFWNECRNEIQNALQKDFEGATTAAPPDATISNRSLRIRETRILGPTHWKRWNPSAYSWRRSHTYIYIFEYCIIFKLYVITIIYYIKITFTCYTILYTLHIVYSFIIIYIQREI